MTVDSRPSSHPTAKWLYYTKTEAPDTSLWKLPVAGGEETQVIPSVHLHSFDVVNDGVYFRADTTTLNSSTPPGRSSRLQRNFRKAM